MLSVFLALSSYCEKAGYLYVEIILPRELLEKLPELLLERLLERLLELLIRVSPS